MTKSLRIIWLIFLVFFSSMLFAQQDDCSRLDQGSKSTTRTFEPPKPSSKPARTSMTLWKQHISEEAKRLEECKRVYEKFAYDRADKLHQYLRSISDPYRIPEVKKAIKNTALQLFKDTNGQTLKNVSYEGYILGKNNEFAEESSTLANYLDALIAQDTIYRVDTIFQILNLDTIKTYDTIKIGEQYNLCWGMPSWIMEEKSDSMVYALKFKPLAISYIPKHPLDNTDSSSNKYMVYTAEMPIREAIAFRRNLTYEKILCKKINFQLRYVPKKYDPKRDTLIDPDRDTLYYWQVSLKFVRKSDDLDACKEIEILPCEKGSIDIKDEVGLPDSSAFRSLQDCKRLVPLWTYAVPGVGFKSLETQKKDLPPWSFITAAWIGTAATAAAHRSEANRFYQKHLEGTVLSERDKWFDKAVASNNRFLYFAGASALIWAVTDIVIFAKDGNQNKKCKRNFEIFQKQQNKPTSMFFKPTLLHDSVMDRGALGFRMGLKFN